MQRDTHGYNVIPRLITKTSGSVAVDYESRPASVAVSCLSVTVASFVLLHPTCVRSGSSLPGRRRTSLCLRRRLGGCHTVLEVKRTALCVPRNYVGLEFEKDDVTRTSMLNAMLFQWAVKLM